MTFKIAKIQEKYKTIYKYDLPNTPGISTLFMHPIHQILKVDLQNNNPVFWAIVYQEEPKKKYQIITLWTGMEYEEKDGTYIGTLTIDELVYHYFIREVYDGTR